MKLNIQVLIKVLAFQCLAVLCSSQGIAFFYFVQQWPQSYCDTKEGCCNFKTGKPAAEFSIHGLWPYYFDGSHPSNCTGTPYNASLISDLQKQLHKDWPWLAPCPMRDSRKLWRNEWKKYGTCSESLLNQRDYFKSALLLKKKYDILKILKNAGIKPNGQFYTLGSIRDAFVHEVGYLPGVYCNVNSSGQSQLYQIYICVNPSASKIVECPGLPQRECGSKIKFPAFE